MHTAFLNSGLWVASVSSILSEGAVKELTESLAVAYIWNVMKLKIEIINLKFHTGTNYLNYN